MASTKKSNRYVAHFDMLGMTPYYPKKYRWRLPNSDTFEDNRAYYKRFSDTIIIFTLYDQNRRFIRNSVKISFVVLQVTKKMCSIERWYCILRVLYKFWFGYGPRESLDRCSWFRGDNTMIRCCNWWCNIPETKSYSWPSKSALHDQMVPTNKEQ